MLEFKMESESDEKGVITEAKIMSLRRERGGLLSALTRMDKEIRQLMLSSASVAEVESRISAIKGTFRKFVEKHDEYKVTIEDDPLELQKAGEYLQVVEQRLEILRSDVAMWEESHILLKQSDELDVDVKCDDSASQVCSKVSSKASSRTKAALKKATLKIRAEALKKKQELKRKQIEMEQMKETLELETELALAEAEENVFAECVSETGSKNPKRLLDKASVDNLLTESKQTQELTMLLNQTESHKIDDVTPRDMKSKELHSPLSYGQGTCDPVESVISDTRVTQQGLQFPYVLDNADNKSPVKNTEKEVISMQQQMLNILQLPKTELMKFDGDPLKYWLFIRAFDNSIEGTGISDSVKLNRLLHYCTSKAFDVIECCSVMEPQQGYSEARRLLKERFGNQFVISKAWVQKVTEGQPLKYGDNMALQKFADNVRSCVVTLKAMDRLSEVDNQIRMSKIVGMLPVFLQGRWRTVAVKLLKRNGAYPDISQLVDFLDTAAAEANDPVFGAFNTQRDIKDKSQRTDLKLNQKGPSFSVQASDTNTGVTQGQLQAKKYPPCHYCGNDHAIYTCDKFKQLGVDKRQEFVKKNKLCFNCFLPQHMSFECKRPSMCNINGCNKKHSRLLHVATTPSNQTDMKSTQITKSIPDVSSSLCGVTGAGVSRIALPIVPVKVSAKTQEKSITTYALLDSGSTHTFCAQSLADQLELQGTKTTLSLTTLSSQSNKSLSSLVSLNVGDIKGKQTMTISHVFVIPRLPVMKDSMVSQKDIIKWPHLADIDLPEFDHTCVTLLIGQMALAPLEVRKVKGDQPYATKTMFGWTLNGPLDNSVNSIAVSNFTQADHDLQEQVEKFWKLDICEVESQQMSVNDKRAIDIWENSIKLKRGHYELPIPFKAQPPSLPNNYCAAEARLESLGKKLCKNKELYEKYKLGIQDLLDKGFAEKVSESYMRDEENLMWYLPHHGVTSETKPDKLRIVFDCSFKFGNASLNEAVLQGPDLTNKLIGVLLRFREEQVAVMGDIESMFHQIKVTPNHRDALRFLWWRDGDMSKEVDIYRMTVHLFGGIWSPSCASFAVRRTAEDNSSDFDPITIQTVLENFYVDDCLKSVNSVKKAIKLIQELNNLLLGGGSKLTKWVSNNRHVLETIPEDRRAKHLVGVDLNCGSLPAERALGVQWDVNSDTFGFKINLKSKPNSRRGLINIISSIYDPFGFVCPMILQAKLIFQDECRLKKAWDDPLEKANERRLCKWKNDLSQIENFQQNRCMVSKEFGDIKKCQVHLFSDASNVGYGAVAYLRVVNSEEKVQSCFLMGKARLAPIKQLTIPRLELSAAVMAVKLNSILCRELRIKIDQSIFWTDSMVVLQYVKNESKRFQTFVANRIATIHNGSTPSDWKYVESKMNPADHASRGLSAAEVVSSSLWRNGPDFLGEDESSWPKTPGIPDISNDDQEVKLSNKVNVMVRESFGCVKLIESHSSWYKLKRSVAWILRLKDCLRKGIQGHQVKMQAKPLGVNQIRQAELEIIKFVQRNSFEDELEHLHKTQTVKRTSSIFKLEPMINDNGVICVRGRLTVAPIGDDARHQIILPRGHHLVSLIVRHYHEQLGHSGTEHVLSYIRQRFWIVKAR